MNLKYKFSLGFLTAVIFFSVCFSGYYLYKRTSPAVQSSPSGRWRVDDAYIKTTLDEERLKLLSLGYLQGHERAQNRGGITLYKENLACPGLNFVVSAHSPFACIMDMRGSVLHTWEYKPAYEIWPQALRDDDAEYWRRAHLYGNGDLLAIYESIGLIKLDKASNLLWAYATEKKAHHDIEVTADGLIYILTRETKSDTSIFDKPMLEDFITILNPDGKPLKHLSILELVDASPYSKLIEIRQEQGYVWGDVFHTNTLEVFDGSQFQRSPLFKKGNILLSLFTVDAICIVDMTAEKIVWALGTGLWRAQHQPTLLQNGNMLIFDNHHTRTDKVRTENNSAVIEIDPFTQNIAWKYVGDEENPFYSMTCGSNQRLPNGNTLISETDRGRAFEVTKNNEIVWEYISPYRAGKNNELVASLPEIIRVEPSHYTFLIDSKGAMSGTQSN